VTAETFAQWKKERKEREAKDKKESLKKKQEEYKKMRAGMKSGMTFSGKELFDFNPDWAKGGDDEDGAMDVYGRDESENQQNGETDDALVSGVEKIKVWDDKPDVEVALDVFENEDLEGLDDDEEEDEE
jgi:hypothetical protein